MKSKRPPSRPSFYGLFLQGRGGVAPLAPLDPLLERMSFTADSSDTGFLHVSCSVLILGDIFGVARKSISHQI